MEVRPSVHNRFCIFSHTTVEYFIGIAVIKFNGIEIACAQTASASHAVILVNGHLLFVLIEDKTAVGAFLLASAASPASLFRNIWLAVAVLFRLAGAGPASHTDILNRAAKTGHLMSFKMRQADEHIRIHNRTADLRLFHILASGHGNQYVVRTL